MIPRLYSLAAAGAASVLLIAACGGTSSPSKTTPPKTTPAKTTPAKSTSSSGTTSSGGLPAGLTGSVLKQAAAGCTKAYNTLPATFGATAKADLAKVCQDLNSGNVSAFKADATSWCNAAIAGVPSAYKSTAQAECSAISKAIP